MQKLVIWDFDGVITDTESLLLQSRIDVLSKNFQINWDMDTIMKKIGGMGDKEAGDILKTINSDIVEISLEPNKYEYELSVKNDVDKLEGEPIILEIDWGNQ